MVIEQASEIQTYYTQISMLDLQDVVTFFDSLQIRISEKYNAATNQNRFS